MNRHGQDTIGAPTTGKEKTQVSRLARIVIVAALALVSSFAIAAQTRAAVAPAPKMDPQLIAYPYNFEAGAYPQPQNTADQYALALTNVGAGDLVGPVTARITLAPGLTWSPGHQLTDSGPWECEGESELTCVLPPGEQDVEHYPLEFAVNVSSAAPEVLTTKVVVSGGSTAGPVEAMFTNPRRSGKPTYEFRP